MVSIVIPTVNGGALLPQCVGSIDQRSTTSLEVIVVDNGSTDGSVDAIIERDPSVRVIRNETNVGYAHACNQGASLAQGRYLLLLNNDVILTSGALDELVATAEANQEAAVWQPVILSHGGEALDSAGSFFTWTGFLWHREATPPLDARPFSVFAAKGACLLIRHDVWEQVGGFDPTFFAYFEDSDLCWRARMAGWDVQVAPAARVLHESGSSSAALFDAHEIDYLSFRNRLRTILANSPVRQLLFVLPIHVTLCCGIALAFLGRGRRSSCVAVFKALWWSVAHSKSWRGARRTARTLDTASSDFVFSADVVSGINAKRAWRILHEYIGQRRWDTLSSDS